MTLSSLTGENHEGGAVAAAKAAAEKGIQVSVLGVGMPDGAPIPVEGTNDFRRDRDGNVVVTRSNGADVSGNSSHREYGILCACRQFKCCTKPILLKEIK